MVYPDLCISDGFCLKCIRVHARLKASTDVLALVTSNTAIAELSLQDTGCRAQAVLQGSSRTACKVLCAAGWSRYPLQLIITHAFGNEETW